MFADAARTAAGMAESVGVPRTAILASTGFNERVLQSDAAAMPEEPLNALLMLIMERTGLDTLALCRSTDTAILSLGILGSLVSAAKSFAHSTDIVLRFAPLVANHAVSMQVEHTSEAVAVRFRCVSRHELLQRAVSEGMLASHLRVLQRCSGASARFATLSLSYPAPAHAAKYVEVFGAEPQFGAEYTEFTVERALAERPSLYHCPKTLAYLTAEAELLLAARTASNGVANAVTRHLNESLAGHLLSMEEIAERLQMSSRSLRRKLVSEGTTFRELSQRALCRSAESLLGDPAVPIKEVSSRLGFESPRGFARALQGAANKSPSELRRQLLQTRAMQH